ncbi:unnamed protein product [Lota lota]
MDPILSYSWKRILRLLSIYFILIYQAQISWGIDSVNITGWHVLNNSESSRIMLPKWDTASQREQVGEQSRCSETHSKERLKASFRRASEPCWFPCLNGGQCVQPESCDCSLYQATGARCQTVPNSGFEREMTCRSWGQYNFETFDGLYYHFPGRCTYTLLRDCEDTTSSSIIVQVHNDPGCQASTYNCTRSISLSVPWEGEVRLHSNTVTFNGQRLELPHHIHDLELEQIAHYVLVTQQQGFTLAWDGHSGSVYIKLSPEFVGRTCGLCGNFNADVQDDIKTSYGVVTADIDMFGNSWMEAEPHEARCPMVPSGFPSPCVGLDDHVLLKVEEVCATLLEEPFLSCHAFVSPLPYMASCSNDLCLSNPSGDVVCQVFTEYARACAHADSPLNDWREHIPQCAKQCPSDLQYRECISCCPATCNLERMCIDSKLVCLDGCYCPAGLIYEDGRCVSPSDCPCEYHGMLYPTGQTVQEDCNNCTCVGGVWNCTEYTCPGECSVTGDMFFQSFDGRVFTFPATCQYVLVKSRNSGKFTVTIQNTPCGPTLDGACIQSVSLVFDEDPRSQITLSHLGEVFRAGQYRVSLPYSDEMFHIQELSSMFLQVSTTLGLQLHYSWREFRLYLRLDPSWKDDSLGLCGTFNGNTQDDFLSPSGMIESTPLLFGNSWRVSSACAPHHSSPQLDPCDTHQQSASYASEMCDLLNQEVFSPCHEYISPSPFHRQCRADTCKCGTPCLCSALAHYARHCRKFSVIVEFRAHVPECAVECPDTMEYGTCVSSCQRRCSTLSSSHHCGEECEEGCVCPYGTFYNAHTHTCVPRSQCPCSFLGTDYEAGDVIITSAGVQLCQNGKLMSQNTDSGKLCPLGQLYQNCSEGEDGRVEGRGVACEQTCQSSLLNLTCSAHEPCVSGCTCPAGFLRHGDECFQPESCPCLWKGKEYYPGDRVSSPCHQCVCQHGTFQCVTRPCPSMCTAYGDRHYKSFDGLLYDYIGACKVYLVKSSSADMVLSVMTENVDCYNGGVICRKSLLINIGRSVVAFDDDSGRPNPSSVVDRRQRMHVWTAGYFTVIHFPGEHVTILWDQKTTVHVQVGPQWQGKLSGLCGNFDLKTVNEMRTPENIDSPTPQEFGNSWTAAECVNSPDIRSPCSLNPLREPFAKRQCGVLLSEVFQSCHPVVDVSWFYMNCLADTCGCTRGGDCECFCSSVAAYAQSCCHQGVPVDWRTPALCPHDCEYYNKVLGKGPFQLVTYLERGTVLAASRSTGRVYLQASNPSASDVLSHFMMTPGLSRSRPHDSSLVSFEAVDRPNYFLDASHGNLRLTKWKESDAFWDGATFVLHRDTSVPGYDSMESFSKRGFFIHATPPRLQLLKHRNWPAFRRGVLFKLTGLSPDTPAVGPRCQWRYDSCVSPCFKTCSDPSGTACVTIPKVEGCLPVCPSHMVLDEVTHRCVHTEDCIKPAVAVQPITPPSAETTPAAVTSEAASTSSSTPSTSTTTSTATTSTLLPITTPTTFTTTNTSFSSPSALTTTPQPPTTSASPTPDLPSRVSTSPSAPHTPSVTSEMMAPHTTVKMTSASLSTGVGATAETTSSPTSTLSSIGPAISRTISPLFSFTALLWLTSSAKITLPQEGKLISTMSPITTTTTTTTTTTVVPTTSTVKTPSFTSTISTSPAYDTPDSIHITTHPAVVTTIVPGLRPTTVSEAVVSERTTTASTSTTQAYLESTKEPRTTEVASSPTTTTITPGSPGTVSRTTSPLPHMSSTETQTTLAPVVTLAIPTEAVTPVVPFTTRKTTTLQTSAEVTIAFTSAATTEKTESTTLSDLPESTSTHMKPTTTTLASLMSLPSTVRGTTEKVTTLVSTASHGPASITTTAVAPPFRTAETTVVPPLTSKHSTESTSWSASIPTPHETTTTAPIEFPDASTTSIGPLVTTKPSVSPVAFTTTTSTPVPTATESSTLKTSTTRTSEPWRQPHWETSSVATYGTEKVTTPHVTSKTSTPTVSATATAWKPHAAITTKKVVSMATSAASTGTGTTTTTPTEITKGDSKPTTQQPLTPTLSAVPLTPETSRTTSSTKTTQRVGSTTRRPITPHLVTEAAPVPPLTGKVEISTIASTTQPPSPWSAQYPTTSRALPRPTTHQEKVTTRVVSPLTATPATTTTTKITTATKITTTPRVMSPTSMPPEVTTTKRTTMRVTTATRLSTATSSLTTPGIPTTTPITGTAVVSVVPSTSTRTISEPASTESGLERIFLTTPVVMTTRTSPSDPDSVPSTTTVKTPTDVPMGVTRELPAATSEKTSTTKETEVAPSAGTTVTSAPAEAASIWIPGTRPSSTSAPTRTSKHPTEPTEPSESTTLVSTSPPVPITQWSTLEATRTTVEVTSSMVISSTRTCTPPYSEFIDECTKYICVNSQLVLFNKTQNCPYNSLPPNCGLLGFAILVNGDKCCPKWDCPCRCSVFPDLNIITFDGNSVAIYKAASYIVTQLPNETVSVLVQECPADPDTLVWNFTNLCLVALNISHKSNHIVINRLQRRLYVNSRYAKPRFRKFGFEILDTGNMYLIRSPSGLKLQWFHSTGMMVIETESSSNKLPTMGLCGYCDGDPANDLTLSNGTIVGESEDPALFIDSWQVPNTTSYISHSRRREVNCSTSDCSHCMAMLQDNSFLPCHDFVPPSTFCELWVRDVEYVNNRCVALAAYVASCHKFNICIEWRSQEYCPFICPGTLRYQACLPACTAQSCPNQDFESDPGQCSGLTEGCVCPEGTLLHRPYSALCIPPDMCACTDSAGVPRANGELWKASKDGCCMYRCENDAIKPVEYNCSAVALPVCHRAGEVVISLANDNSCCPQKACVCNQSLCDVDPPLCNYGEKLVSYYRQDSCCPHYTCECDSKLCESEVPVCREDQSLIATRTDGSCCLAHICMCNACPETIPLCEEGEVLTVDANSTDRCCPDYQCVCETYRCSQVSCPVGMSVSPVPSPVQCCPNHICVCSCEKISAPKCALGETTQLDRAFLTDPLNQCACRRYKCVREAVCVDGERGMMRPGQTLVEHSPDGLCHSTQCTSSLDPATGYHHLRTISTNCSARCQPNQLYIAPRDQTACCGVCRNISCLYRDENGTVTLHKPGKTWVSNCKKYECADTVSGPTLISYAFSCPPFNETECMKVGGSILSYMDGCCKTCKEDGKSCQRVTVRMTIRKNDCRSNRPVNIVSCDGKCPSASIYNYNINTYARFCKCCREMGLQRRSVQLYCSGNSTWVSYSIQEPTDCSCQWS